MVAQYVLNGFVSGMILALPAIGLTLVYGILKFPNFAFGAMMTVGAYIALVLNVNFGLSLLWSAALAAVIFAMIAVVVAVAAKEHIRVGAAEQQIGAPLAQQRVVAKLTEEKVICRASGQGVVSGTAEEGCGRQRTVGLVQSDLVVAILPKDLDEPGICDSRCSAPKNRKDADTGRERRCCRQNDTLVEMFEG